MASTLADNLRTYKLQLSQVEAALIAEPENPELQKLQTDLQEVIALTTEMLKDQVNESAPSSSSRVDDESFAPDEGDVKPELYEWKGGDQCLAPWSKDKTGRLYRAIIEEVNEGGLCTIVFPKWGTPDVTLASKLRPLPAHLKAKIEAEEEEEELRKASSLTGAKKEDILKQREYLKKKKQKKLEKLKKLDKVRETDKNKWLNFKSKAIHKSKKGVMKESIFRSPESVDGRVGVGTCGLSGKGMTDYKNAKKYARNV